MNHTTSDNFCNHVQIPLDLFVGDSVKKIPDGIRIYMYLLHYNRWLDYYSIANLLGMSVDAVKARCTELAKDNLIERSGGDKGMARARIHMLPEADPDRLRVHQALMAKKEDAGHHVNQQPLKKKQQGLDASLMGSLTYRFTDEEFFFLVAQRGLDELQFWAKTLPADCESYGATKAVQREFPDMPAKEAAIIWCVRGAMKHVQAGHKINKLTGWLRHVVKEWREQNNSLRHELDKSDRSNLPTLAQRLSKESEP